jgi:cytochrome b6-f complex iron-sulfur subunit
MNKQNRDTLPERVHKRGSTESRRHFIARFWKWLGVIAAVELVWAAISFLHAGKKKNRTTEKALFTGIADVKDIPVNTVYPYRPGRMYLCRLENGGFLALSLKCTHLGCPVEWDKEKEMFVCPCHASTFSITGEVLSPPATRPLDRYPVKIENGTVYVDLVHPVPSRAHQQVKEEST